MVEKQIKYRGGKIEKFGKRQIAGKIDREIKMDLKKKQKKQTIFLKKNGSEEKKKEKKLK